MKELVYELHPEFGDLKDNEADGVLAKEWILDAWGYISQGLIDSLLDFCHGDGRLYVVLVDGIQSIKALSRSNSFIVVALDLHIIWLCN